MRTNFEYTNFMELIVSCVYHSLFCYYFGTISKESKQFSNFMERKIND